MRIKTYAVILAVLFTLSSCGVAAPSGDNDNNTEVENFALSVLSAELHPSLTNAPGVEYTPSADNAYLMIVFRATNISNDTKNVMNTNFNSYIDGSKIPIQSIVGEINGYMPLVGAVSAGQSFDGYAVWEVPKSADKLELSYIDANTGEESGYFEIIIDELQ